MIKKNDKSPENLSLRLTEYYYYQSIGLKVYFNLNKKGVIQK